MLIASNVASSRFLAISFYYLLCGIIPPKMKLLPDGNCAITHNGFEMVKPKDGGFAYIEMFNDNIYERYGSPKKGDIVIDVGAYVGMFSIKAAGLVDDSGLVLAIEPAPDNLELLSRNLNTFKISNIRVIDKAALDKKEKVKLYLSRSSACHTVAYSHKNYIEVEGDTLDNITSELGIYQVNFIKIDVEGRELEVLKGAKRLLESSNIRLAIASYHDLPDGKKEFLEIASYLKSKGFHVEVYKESYVYAIK